MKLSSGLYSSMGLSAYTNATMPPEYDLLTICVKCDSCVKYCHDFWQLLILGINYIDMFDADCKLPIDQFLLSSFYYIIT